MVGLTTLKIGDRIVISKIIKWKWNNHLLIWSYIQNVKPFEASFPFCNPCKHQDIRGFLMFSGDMV